MLQLDVTIQFVSTADVRIGTTGRTVTGEIVIHSYMTQISTVGALAAAVLTSKLFAGNVHRGWRGITAPPHNNFWW
jgi:hypothetical protein